MAKALLLIDLQNDFLPGGSLAVADSDKIIPLANSLMPLFKHVIATKDYHPHNHKSFASQHANKKVGDLIKLADLDQILWPDHCVQNEVGSELSPKLNTKMINKIFYKGTNPYVDSYSAFFDNYQKKSTDLDLYLKNLEVENLYLLGLATDYCVKYSVLDAISLGFNTYLISDACKAVELNPGDSAKAIAYMKEKGAHIVNSRDLI